MVAHNREADGRAIPELDLLNRPLGLLPAAKVRALAKELELQLNPLHPSNIDRLLGILNLTPDHSERLSTVLKNGVNHQVLNARKHTEESQIIANAGAFGAVTIATNMAGRGVDIKLGGELPEEILTQVNRVLRRAGYKDAFGMSLDEKEAAIQKLERSDYGIYENDIDLFLNFMKESQQVKSLGGLHVIGSERHESRRIDNQLRGRSSRQGDPGSSRFYLSMQDQLMRIFGGQQAEGMMERLKIDEDMPIEMGMVGRIVEQSQTRVEGANFDTRKHLLEYDDVLNAQRATIYGQRDRIFTKDDLTEDVNEMVQAEVSARVPIAMADTEGPWRLLAWADQTQPPLIFGNLIYPSLSLRLLVEDLEKFSKDPKGLIEALIQLSAEAIQAEADHVVNSTNELLETTLIKLRDQYEERADLLEMFLEGIDPDDETDIRSSKDLQSELISLIRTPIRLDNQELARLKDDPDELFGKFDQEIEAYIVQNAATRLETIVERRLGEGLGDLGTIEKVTDWDEFGDRLLEAIQASYEDRRERFIGQAKDGSISKDVITAVEPVKGEITQPMLIQILLKIPQGQRASFDKRTRQRIWQRTTRLTFVYRAAQFLNDREPEEVESFVIKHLQDAQDILKQGLGMVEFTRLGESTLEDLSRPLRRALNSMLEDDVISKISTQPLKNLDPTQSGKVADALGRYARTATYRQLLLRVISELWVEYLTQMEALRISVGLEAYAQRDPLVAYKAKASELFQELIRNSRVGVVSRMFTYRVQSIEMTTGDSASNGQPSLPDGQGSGQPDTNSEGPALTGAKPTSQKGKKRRRRRKKS